MPKEASLDARGLGYIAQYSQILRSLSADRALINNTGVSAQIRKMHSVEYCEKLYGVISLFLEA